MPIYCVLAFIAKAATIDGGTPIDSAYAFSGSHLSPVAPCVKQAWAEEHAGCMLWYKTTRLRHSSKRLCWMLTRTRF